jgi:hypothetical protein
VHQATADAQALSADAEQARLAEALAGRDAEWQAKMDAEGGEWEAKMGEISGRHACVAPSLAGRCRGH